LLETLVFWVFLVFSMVLTTCEDSCKMYGFH